jgi:hypothetical protein
MVRQSSLFEFRHGDHVCVFYRNQDGLMEVLTPYVADGLRNGEKCFGAQKAETVQRLYYDLRFLGIDVEKEIERGALDFHTVDTVYLPEGTFEPKRMMDMLVRSIDAALASGFSGFRSAGDLSWAASGQGNCDLLVGYEQLVEKSYPGRAAVGLCQYCIADFSPEVLNRVLDAHRLQLIEPESNGFHASICIRYGHCLAELVTDKFVVNPNYYYVVQRHEPKEILGFGVADDFERATTEVHEIARETATLYWH